MVASIIMNSLSASAANVSKMRGKHPALAPPSISPVRRLSLVALSINVLTPSWQISAAAAERACLGAVRPPISLRVCSPQSHHFSVTAG
jgi:hypothetical protein